MIAHDPRLQFRSFNHVSGSAINPQSRSSCHNALNLLPLFSAQRTWPDLLLARPRLRMTRRRHCGSAAKNRAGLTIPDDADLSHLGGSRRAILQSMLGLRKLLRARQSGRLLDLTVAYSLEIRLRGLADRHCRSRPRSRHRNFFDCCSATLGTGDPRGRHDRRRLYDPQ